MARAAIAAGPPIAGGAAADLVETGGQAVAAAETTDMKWKR